MADVSVAAAKLSIGALEISVLVGTFLYAITCAQIYVYWRSNFNDRFVIRLLIAAVWLGETIHTVFFWIHRYRVTVIYYGEPNSLALKSWSLDYSIPVHGIISALVQMYYSWRVRVLSGRSLVTIISWIGSFLEVVGSITVAALLEIYGPVTHVNTVTYAAIATISMDVIVDIINTAALCYCLHRKRIGFHKTDTLINTITLWTVESGIITLITAIAMLITFIVIPETEIYVSLTAFYAKLYSNSLMASFNSRGPLGPGKFTSNDFDGSLHISVTTSQIKTQSASHVLPRFAPWRGTTDVDSYPLTPRGVNASKDDSDDNSGAQDVDAFDSTDKNTGLVRETYIEGTGPLPQKSSSLRGHGQVQVSSTTVTGRDENGIPGFLRNSHVGLRKDAKSVDESDCTTIAELRESGK